MHTRIVRRVLLLLLVTTSACGQPIADRPAERPGGGAMVVPAAPQETALAATPAPTLVTVARAAPFTTAPYQGPAVPTPHAHDRYATARPAWLVVGDRLVPGTRGTHGTSDALPSPDFLKTITKVTVPGQTSLVVIVSTTPIERFSASTEV